jgi:hypothetical protein
MTNSEALIYVADKIGIQAQYYTDTHKDTYLESMKAYIRTANIFLDRIERGEKWRLLLLVWIWLLMMILRIVIFGDFGPENIVSIKEFE